MSLPLWNARTARSGRDVSDSVNDWKRYQIRSNSGIEIRKSGKVDEELWHGVTVESLAALEEVSEQLLLAAAVQSHL